MVKILTNFHEFFFRNHRNTARPRSGPRREGRPPRGLAGGGPNRRACWQPRHLRGARLLSFSIYPPMPHLTSCLHCYWEWAPLCLDQSPKAVGAQCTSAFSSSSNLLEFWCDLGFSPCLVFKKNSTVFVTSNIQTHTWSIKYSFKK